MSEEGKKMAGVKKMKAMIVGPTVWKNEFEWERVGSLVRCCEWMIDRPTEQSS
jgi:hypothetical protein